MQWVIKATKLCNLRCKYCYEWDHLSDPTRMSEEVWKRTFLAIRDYYELSAKYYGFPIPTDIIWHGGEPLTLPTSYFTSVLKIQNDIFPREWIDGGHIRNCMQTNLYSLSDDHLDLLYDHEFDLGVSVDFTSGVRLTAAGRETEDKVRDNLRRLKAKGIPYSVITVLARHTVSEVESVFKDFVQFDAPVRLLPLFSGSSARPMDGVDISGGDVIDAMFRLFELWFEAGMAPEIDPFDDGVQTVTRKKLNLVCPRQDRKRPANEVLVIDRDGTLSCAAFRDSRPIGNVAHMTMSEIIRSKEYQSLIREETQLKEAICNKCSFVGACDTGPIARNFDSQLLRDCPTEKYLYPKIEAYLERHDFFDKDFHETARSMKKTYLQELMPQSASPPH